MVENDFPTNWRIISTNGSHCYQLQVIVSRKLHVLPKLTCNTEKILKCGSFFAFIEEGQSKSLCSRGGEMQGAPGNVSLGGGSGSPGVLEKHYGFWTPLSFTSTGSRHFAIL